MKHSHYKKPVTGLEFVDVYRVLALFGVTDPCLQHAVKKLLVAGGRGAKDISQDVQEAIDTLQRWQEMQLETPTMPATFGQQHTINPLSVVFFEEPASQIDDDSPRMQAIAQNGNDGAVYVELDRMRADHSFNDDVPASMREAAGQREPCQPRHRCLACAGGHSTHQCGSDS